MKDITLHDPQAITQYATKFGASGYFSDAREASQAFVKISAGMELGFGAFQSMSGIHIINGKPSVSAHLMAAAIKRSDKYDYRVLSHTDEECSIQVFEMIGGKPEKPGPPSTFTLDDARRAGIFGNPNWKKYPKNMLFARAISNAVKFQCPDVFGTAVYTHDEMGLEVDEAGDIIDTTAVVNEPAPDPAHNGSTGTDWSDDAVFKNAAWEASGKSMERLITFCDGKGIDDPANLIKSITDARERAAFVAELKGGQ